MKSGARKNIVFGVVFTLIVAPSLSAWGQATLLEPLSDRERAEATLKLAMEKAAEFEFFLADDGSTRLVLESRSLLRWSNPVATALYGEVFLWTAKGRPQAIASMHKFFQPERRHMSGEFHSLALGNIVARRDDQDVWTPREPGVTLNVLPAAPPVGRSAQQRLSQMRGLARGFSAETSVRNEPDNREQLRLLPKPIYRYASSTPDLVDGAIFTFVQGTNPEVLLLLEARKSGKTQVWHYGFARFNSVALSASHNQRQVWSVPQIAPPWKDIRNPNKAYFVSILDPGE